MTLTTKWVFERTGHPLRPPPEILHLKEPIDYADKSPDRGHKLFKDPHKDCSGIEDHAFERAVIDVLVVVGDVYPPFAGLLRLKRSIKCPVLFAH